jgi:hypothetical protein
MIQLHIRDAQTAFRPGETLAGETVWQLDQPPRSVEVRLFWFTRGRGTEDVELVQSVSFESPGQDDQRPFQFSLPHSPYSFSGKLISLIWAVEVVAKPGGAARVEFTLSPTLSEILLQP